MPTPLADPGHDTCPRQESPSLGHCPGHWVVFLRPALPTIPAETQACFHPRCWAPVQSTWLWILDNHRTGCQPITRDSLLLLFLSNKLWQWWAGGHTAVSFYFHVSPAPAWPALYEIQAGATSVEFRGIAAWSAHGIQKAVQAHCHHELSPRSDGGSCRPWPDPRTDGEVI